MTFLPDGHVAVAPGQRHAVAEAVTIWLSPAPIFFHVPDWHGGQCQSGVWRTSGSSNGSYSNLGSHRGSFTGRNTGSGTLFVYASGGNGGSAGGDCANTSRLQGYVAGALISTWDLRAPAPTPSHLRATVAIKGSFRGAEF